MDPFYSLISFFAKNQRMKTRYFLFFFLPLPETADHGHSAGNESPVRPGLKIINLRILFVTLCRDLKSNFKLTR